MHEISIPVAFAIAILDRVGEPSRAWLDALPETVSDLCQRWELTVDGEPRHGHLAIVVPVLHHTGPAALKVTWQTPETTLEAYALNLWAGRDAVRVLESSSNDGALLLERLDAERTLFHLPFDQGIAVAGQLMRNLAIPGDDTLPTTAGLAAEFAHTAQDRWDRMGRSIPRHHLDQAVEKAAILAADVDSRMVNWDLHHGNVLFSPTREQWVVVDPKPAVGALESGVAPLFWTRVSDLTGPQDFHGQLDTLIEVAELDAELTRSWLLLRMVDFWLWELSVGLADDPGGCATILDWLGE